MKTSTTHRQLRRTENQNEERKNVGNLRLRKCNLHNAPVNVARHWRATHPWMCSKTNHQGSVAWIDRWNRWVPIRIVRQNYVRFGDRIENAVRAAQLSKISRQLRITLWSQLLWISLLLHNLHNSENASLRSNLFPHCLGRDRLVIGLR